jgi:hypothetical protein
MILFSLVSGLLPWGGKMQRKHSRFFFTNMQAIAACVLIMSFLGGCASIPKESVELSYMLGQDLETLHQSYKSLIRSYFQCLRHEINNAIDRTFIPAYIGDYIKTGRLIEHAKADRADIVEAWVRIAVETIDKERTKRLEPIDKAENELLSAVDEAFDKAVIANATVTAHINSIRKADQVQEEILESLKLDDIRGRINRCLAAASKMAKQIASTIESSESNRSN